ncbi:hypothetical protein IVB16_31965 [Bradyrhizobium sp. 183]|uniref:hypothetical protein n=1 Tax=unclassified Bradyrhizobium TaxID=2631580 RepID=UPI001FFE9670|nr:MULTISPECIES: hypothetical protein [unclassified Bradyrhizobium]UPJ79322.1 hypothetical protein IVB17_31965 [Bradyrhizobium sp. 184]UPJ87116.1 hypothetical protein IVB16_31965 [Bradyrhizobium sp. 183]
MQPKTVAYPTDARLHRAIIKLLGVAARTRCRCAKVIHALAKRDAIMVERSVQTRPRSA